MSAAIVLALVPVAAASARKFVARPVAAWRVEQALGLSGVALTVAPPFQALPTFSMSYLMARASSAATRC